MLILMIKDGVISETEEEIIMSIGKTLGFERRFCGGAIKEVSENEFILDHPPIFSDSKYAESFILDGLTLALSDREIDPEELKFLKSTASANNISEEWFSEIIKSHLNDKVNLNGSLKIVNYL